MKKLILTLLLLAPSVVLAEPSSNVAWTPETLNFVKNGNPERGKALAASCAGCHGENGISTVATYPSLAGQLATYTYKQLRDYADGRRDNAMMAATAQSLNKQNFADLAAWFASLPAAKNKSAYPSIVEKASELVKRGDGKRTLPPCMTCHGPDGQGEKMHIPALAGQQADYIEQTLRDYQNGNRHNDIYSRMRLISEELNDQEIKAIAEYYQGL